MVTEQEISEVLSRWGIVLHRSRPEIPIAGSPERTEYRIVVEERGGSLYVLEQIALPLKARKLKIAETLEALTSTGFKQARAYLHSASGEILSECKGGLWQVIEYVPGVPLRRPEYVYDRWRGKVMAELLLDLRRCSVELPSGRTEPVFSLPDYIEKLMVTIAKNRPEILARARLMQDFACRNLYPVYPSLPTAFCHGDYHPVNIIWKEDGIAALIDWEFTGVRPELYDAANAVGCLGIEDPECLWGGTIKDFIAVLREGSLGSEVSFRNFPALVMALRFAWLSEWLRREDDEMIEMEFDYFDVLAANREDFSRLWGG